MDALDPWLRLALGLLASAVLPSLLYLALRRPPARRLGQRIAAWSCLWAAQLLLPLVAVAWLSLVFGHDVHRLGSLLAALVFGGGGAAIAAVVAASAARLLRVGASILRMDGDERPSDRCDRAATGSLVGLLGVAALWSATAVLPIPGRFGAIVYLVLVLGPIGVASMILLVVAFATRTLVRG